MPFLKPTLRTILGRIIADINARLPGADARLPVSNLNVLSFAISNAVSGLYGYLDWIAKQILPDTSDEEFFARQASIIGLDRKPASPATGNIDLTGTSGTMLTGTLWQRADGVQYQTTSDVSLSSGAATVEVVAVIAGASSSMTGGALSLVSPVAGFDSAGTLVSELSGGADLETLAAWRARYLTEVRTPPQGGAAADYIKWALAVPGVTRAWCYPGEMGAATVTVRFTRDNDASIIPDSGEVSDVQDYIDARRPVTATTYVVAPIAAPIALTIDLTPDTSAVRAAVQAELEDLLLREAEPGGTIFLSHIRAAISNAAGEMNYAMSVPSTDVTNTTGYIATLGTITWL